MTAPNDFVHGERLPDIEYLTDAPHEVVSPRVRLRDGVATVYIHKERQAHHRGYVPVSEFLKRLARRESGLAVTGYRASGRQTTISFNKRDRVTLSDNLQRYLTSLLSPVFDEEAQDFLDGFMDSGNPQFVRWLPRYRRTLQAVQDALRQDALSEIFELIWKSVDNAVSNAGQGVLGFEAADRMRQPLVEMIGEIAADGSAEKFDALIERFKLWRERGSLPKVPKLLLARAFSAIHPNRFHTTVDASKQDHIIPWFVQHTGFVAQEGNWAFNAAALTSHLERSGVFAGDIERRNMFPWYVFDQLRDTTGKFLFRPGHISRQATGIADSKARQRAIEYRQNLIQDRLVQLLRDQHGDDAVATEHATGTGGRADALVKRSDGMLDLYEIKPAATAREAVREAMGQLLEYAYRRNGLQPASLHVVSDAPMDEVTKEYLQALEARFGLCLGYLQVIGVEKGAGGDE